MTDKTVIVNPLERPEFVNAVGVQSKHPEIPPPPKMPSGTEPTDPAGIYAGLQPSPEPNLKNILFSKPEARVEYPVIAVSYGDYGQKLVLLKTDSAVEIHQAGRAVNIPDGLLDFVLEALSDLQDQAPKVRDPLKPHEE